ncbi:calcium-binding protein [Streptomyces tsukubensis]|uniref:Calcium-binding protein n=1 Tax=Streptomyces tsukubensis TaxID=83656 RepID=A0A1V4A4N6_9ACTN|nr:calcium-binding protein [Streptomyces tsukubensis]OON74903.1 calcium-binding protein [Streptomyces tsukubensis]QFR94784.1 calcium-binding protein [Streptomyces tsukubensis]
MRIHRTIAATATLALTLGTAALVAPSAQAAGATATVVHEDGKLWYKAAPGQQNQLTVDEEIEQRGEFESYYVLTFHDRYDIDIDATSATWDECVYPTQGDHGVVRCAVEIPQNSDDSDSYDIDLGDEDDTATLEPDSDAWAGVHGGPGDDVLKGSASSILHGDDGDDSLDGGGGPFGFGSYGGPGNDTLTHCGQDCFGEAGNDSLTGTDEENNLHGDDGDDILHGQGGADVLYGGKGNDMLYGEAGDDTLWGNSGDDVLWGGPGTDALSGGAGTNELHQD